MLASVKNATPANVLGVAWLERVIGRHVQVQVLKLRAYWM